MARSVRQFKETIEFRSLPLNRIRSHRYFPAAVLGLVILTASCIHVWQRVMVRRLSMEVAELRIDHEGLVDAAQKIQTDITKLTMATRVERYAIDTLRMERISPDRVIPLALEEETELSRDRLATLFSSIKRVTRYFPIINEAQAESPELRPINLGRDEDAR